MIDDQLLESCKARFLELFKQARVALTGEEENNLEIADFGLGDLEPVGFEFDGVGGVGHGKIKN